MRSVRVVDIQRSAGVSSHGFGRQYRFPDAHFRDVACVIKRVVKRAGDALRDELTAYAREKLSGIKIPRRIDFREELPRHDTGKLYKRLLRDEYWATQEKIQ